MLHCIAAVGQQCVNGVVLDGMLQMFRLEASLNQDPDYYILHHSLILCMHACANTTCVILCSVHAARPMHVTDTIEIRQS